MTRRLGPGIAAMVCLLWACAVSGWAAVPAYSKGDRVNVRSRAGYAGEIITQLQRGQQVSVLSTNQVVATTADEPTEWYRISLPEGTALWVNAQYVDAETRTVTGDVLNVRAGPSVDHATVARLKRGAVIPRLDEVREGWLKISAPEGAFGYVPALWMTFEAAGAPVSASTPVAPASTAVPRVNGDTVKVVTPPPTAAPSIAVPPPASASESESTVTKTNVPVLPVPAPPPPPGGGQGVRSAQAQQSAVVPPRRRMAAMGAPPLARGPRTNEVVQVPTPVIAPATNEVVVRPAIKKPDVTEGRWVRREGVVVRPSHIQAPTFYALKSRDGGRTINFLMTTREAPIAWNEYRGRVVMVTGREYLDRRPLWKGIPLLDVEEIESAR
ncbi:MAG: SH3 domain-containing protein [Verrucomicrobiales bacterium]|nr:SH3 domain-containing protein [Verrucomicrobiales bacterium]